MADLQQDNPASDAWRFNPRVFLVREWPYLLVLVLAILGIAYTSFAKTPITTLLDRSGAVHWTRLCRHAVARRRKPRAALASDLDAGTALGRGARGNALHVHSRRQPDDERRCQRACGIDGARTGDLYGWRSHRSMAHLSGRRGSGARGSSHRVARAISATSSVGRDCRLGGHCTIFLASQTIGSTSSGNMRARLLRRHCLRRSRDGQGKAGNSNEPDYSSPPFFWRGGEKLVPTFRASEI